MANKRVFISFAVEDSTYRDFLVGQARNDKSPFEFTDMSVNQPWDEKWKTNCRIKIKGCDGFIVLLSKKTAKAEGALWEIRCAKEEKIPILGIHIDRNNKAAIPSELAGQRVIEWNWTDIKKFIDGL